uniref:STAS/SEC14 domain-containing protein n=1 Tax=viral metagenome TaxID=1070528 RepID=A0A6C0D2P6_9ZZZZ
MSATNVNIEKFAEFTHLLTKDYRILYLTVEVAYPSPLQWTFFINELNENLNVLKKLDCRFAFILDMNKIGLISSNYILEFVNVLKSESELLESKLIASSIIYEGSLINKLFEIVKYFYETKKPIEFVSDMRKAIAFIESHEKD